MRRHKLKDVKLRSTRMKDKYNQFIVRSATNGYTADVRYITHYSDGTEIGRTRHTLVMRESINCAWKEVRI